MLCQHSNTCSFARSCSTGIDNQSNWFIYSCFISSAEDVQSIVTGKLALKYTRLEIVAMQNIARASRERSVAEFEKVGLYRW